MTQNEKIEKHLNRGWSITALQALNKYGVFRLASRISDLKNKGLDIDKVMETIDGKRFAKYYKRR